MDRQICPCPSLLRQPVGSSRIFREEHHRGAFRFWSVARSRLRRAKSVTVNTAVCDQYVPWFLRFRDPRKSVTARPSFRLTSSFEIFPASKAMRRIRALTAVTTPRGDNSLTIPILCTRKSKSTSIYEILSTLSQRSHHSGDSMDLLVRAR
jgi:hypothetical protein